MSIARFRSGCLFSRSTELLVHDFFIYYTAAAPLLASLVVMLNPSTDKETLRVTPDQL